MDSKTISIATLKTMMLEALLVPEPQTASKWITDLNVGGKKLFEDNMGVNLHDLRLGNSI